MPNEIGAMLGSSLNWLYNPYAIPTPRPKGRIMPSALTDRATFQLLNKKRRSTSSPTRNKKSTKPMLATSAKLGMASVGKIAFVKPGMRPMIEGPRTIPPMTSAMTLGWRSLERGHWRRRQRMRMMLAWRGISLVYQHIGRPAYLDNEDNDRIFGVIV